MVSSVREKGTDRAFEFFVGFLRSADEPHRGHAIAVNPQALGQLPRRFPDDWPGPR